MKFLKDVFKPIIILESRKEDLRKKYSNKFDDETLDWILNISDLVDFNHKYTDFILKRIDSQFVTEDIQSYIDAVKDFDKYQSNLEKKDINQYDQLSDLQNVLDQFEEKKELKKLESQIERIYEDEQFLVIIPNTEESSCKYGSNTRWCVTSKGTDHYKRYTSGNQRLYFIINKKKSNNRNYSKIAIHFNESGHDTWYDSQDVTMSDREKEIFKYAFPELISSIMGDYKKYKSSSSNSYVNRIFNGEIESGGVSKSYDNFLNSGKELTVVIEDFQILPDLGEGHAMATLKIYLTDNTGGKEIDAYSLFMTYKEVDGALRVDVGFQGEDFEGSSSFIDLELENESFEISTYLSNPNQTPPKYYRTLILNRIIPLITENKNLIKNVIGHSNTWRPNRGSYGYTFKENKGLIKKLVDYLDSGYDNGTKLDFLEYIGKIKSKTINGKKHYAHADSDDYRPSGDWRGHFSAFFASAKNAGIIQYVKEGNKNLIKKGPNFEDFKEGNLVAL